MNTKDRILDEALTLFSLQGVKGTSVKDIAGAVGIKDSSLYKHFKSKREIFDTIVAKMHERIGEMSNELGMSDEEGGRLAADFCGHLSLDELKKLVRKTFLFYLEDDFMARFWRVANMEQYRSPEVYDVYHRLFMEESIAYQTKLFSEMIEGGYLKAIDPAILAVDFYAFIFFLLDKYNGRPDEKDEALAVLDRQVEEFYRVYHA